MSSVAEKLARKSSKPGSTKQVRLKLVYVDFWSAVKLAFLVMVALGIVLIVGAFLVYMVVASTPIFDTVSSLYGEVSGDENFRITDVLGLGQVLGLALVLAILNIVVGTVLGAIATILYNLSVRITGGVLVGFANQ